MPLTVTLKFPIDPLYVLVVPDAVLADTVVVPVGTKFVPALSLPLTLMLAVPWVMVCDPLRLWNVGANLLTTKVPVSECVPLRLPVPVTVKL